MRARICRFYGFSHDEVGQMNYADVLRYYKCITHIQAEEMLNNITTSSAHAMDKKSRSQLHKKLERLKFKDDIPVMSMDQFAGKQWQKLKQP